jgi:hypothetical protein
VPPTATRAAPAANTAAPSELDSLEDFSIEKERGEKRLVSGRDECFFFVFKGDMVFCLIFVVNVVSLFYCFLFFTIGSHLFLCPCLKYYSS